MTEPAVDTEPGSIAAGTVGSGAEAAGAATPVPAPVAIATRPFVLALCGAVAVLSGLRWWLVHTRGDHFSTAGTGTRTALGASLVTQIGFTVAFVVVAVAALLAGRAGAPLSRARLCLLGGLASVVLAMGLGAVLVSIYRREEGSYRLLAESFALYLAVNLVFLFWYWYADHPLRQAALDPTRSLTRNEGIFFPEEDMAERDGTPGVWLPRLTDYAYFTVLSSNGLGAPEGHVLIGSTLKRLQIAHTMFMIFLFIIIVSRAVNTLA